MAKALDSFRISSEWMNERMNEWMDEWILYSGKTAQAAENEDSSVIWKYLLCANSQQQTHNKEMGGNGRKWHYSDVIIIIFNLGLQLTSVEKLGRGP